MEERAVSGLHESLATCIAEIPKSTPVLDLGCGSGAWAARLRSLGFTDVSGVDLHPPTGFIRADLNDKLDLDRTFGLITAIEVIEHLGNPGNLLASAAEVLAPDGVFLLTTPNIHSLRARLRFALTAKLPSFDEKGDPTHVTPVNVFGLQRMAERHGLLIEKSWTYPARGSLIFGRAIRSAAAIARIALPDPLPGDNLAVLLKLRA